MSVSKATILALANFLCVDLGDTTEMDRIYYEVELELAHDPRRWQASRVAGAVTHTDKLVSVTGLHHHVLFYGGRQLTEVMQEELDAQNPLWRDAIGTPVAFTRSLTDGHIVRLYPRSSDTTQAVLTVSTITTDTNIPDILTLPFALLIVAREFARESNHRDLAFAEMANKLANELLEMVA